MNKNKLLGLSLGMIVILGLILLAYSDMHDQDTKQLNSYADLAKRQNTQLQTDTTAMTKQDETIQLQRQVIADQKEQNDLLIQELLRTAVVKTKKVSHHQIVGDPADKMGSSSGQCVVDQYNNLVCHMDSMQPEYGLENQ